ncbi:MAG: LPS export ABC transporter ATP-binding protein [Verrucomicrobia bacterium]|nr:LPS export ABC transporter ATP-binding protein [Verrucomicrobiota bacterium]
METTSHPAVEIRKPVKLRPPGSDDSPPPDHSRQTPPISRPASVAAVNPAVAPHPPSEIREELEDEEFVALGDVPDFSDFDLPPVESTSPPIPPKDAKPVFEPIPQPVTQSRPPSPGAASARPTAVSAVSPNTPAVAGTAPPVTSRREIAFASDQSLSHQDNTGSLLQTHGLVKIYDGRTVVNGVDIHVRPGEIVGLLGPNGAGKTTSFYMIVGLVPPNGGQVLFNGHDVTTMPMYQRARLGMGYLPQEESIFRKLTVEENLLAVLETLDLPRTERLARCQELLERFSITHIRKNVALTCSGGEKRRLTIARSLVTMPSLLMLDEPFSGVDPIAVNEIQNIVDDLRKSGLAILITDHNARQTLELVDRAYLIYEGRVLREGTRDFLINDPVSRELYLGDRFTM